MNISKQLIAMLAIINDPEIDVVKPYGYNKLSNPGKGKAMDAALKTIIGDDERKLQYIENLIFNNCTLSELIALEGDIHLTIKQRLNG